MAKVRRTKNIFNQNIENQSLFQTDGQGQFKVGEIQIKSDWLRDAPPQQYIKNIYSSIKLAQLRQQLQKLKYQAKISLSQDEGQLSSPTKANLFKITILKKKIMSFELDSTGDTRKINDVISSNKKFKIAQPPTDDDMLIQKITTSSIAFFQKPITRKCFLRQKQIIVESKKNEEKMDQWAKIDLETYTMEVDYKSKITNRETKNVSAQLVLDRNQNSNKNSEQFQAFQWVEGYNTRILLSKLNQRSYCLYLKQEKVDKLLRYLKFSDFQKSLQKNKTGVFSQLSNQLFQKVFTLFNNKLRMYDFRTKQKTIDRGSPSDSPIKNFLSPNQPLNSQFNSPKKTAQIDKKIKSQEQIQFEPDTKTPKLKRTQSSIVRDQNVSEILYSPPMRRQSISQIGNVSMFKLRTKKVTVNYDELEGDVNIVDLEKQRNSQQIFDSPGLSSIKDPQSSPDYRIFDFKLDLKDEGMSEADEDSMSPSIIQNRKRVTNLSVSGNIFRQINEKGLKEEEDPRNQFNINIHEIESESQNQKNEDRNRSSGPFFVAYDEEGKDSIPRMNRRNTDSSMSSLRLEEIDDQSSFQRHYSEPKIISPRSFHTNSSEGHQSGGGKIRMCLRQRLPNMTGACYGVEMLYPYRKEKLRFQILQVDPEIQMQKYQVVCSQAQLNFTEKPNCSPRYSLYGPQGKNSDFGLIRQSNKFIFILKEQSNQSFYSTFEINMQEVKYQKDMSQIILIGEDNFVSNLGQKSPRNIGAQISFSKKIPSAASNIRHSSRSQGNKNSYKFAAIVRLYISPTQIQYWSNQSTTEFLEKYVKMATNDPHYDFKHNFIDQKKRYYQIRDQISKKCVLNMLKTGLGKQQDNLKEIIFNGIPEEIVTVIERKLLKQQNITPQKVWRLINFHSDLQARELKLLQESIVPLNLRTIKLMLKPLQLIYSLMSFQSYNKALRKRIYQIAVFFLQQNPFTNVIENFIIALSKQILLKLENVLIRTKNQEQIKAIIKIYLEIQYEVDQLFAEVRKYFV